MTGIAVFAHGSSVETANEAVRTVTDSLRERIGHSLIETAFLELGTPDLTEAVRRLVSRGATRVHVLPYFLTLGIHLQRDLPRIVSDIQSIYPGVRIEVAEPLDGHPALVEILLDRATEAIYGGGRSESQAG